MAKATHLVNASAAQRLGAWLLDAAPVAVLGMIFSMVLGPAFQRAVVAPETLSSSAGTLLLYTALTVAYAVFQWWWEATQGKTLGNIILGLRTTDEDGFAPGWGRVFLRRLVIWLAGVVPVLGPILVVVSNLWDANHQRQGWHDKLARTLMMDVRAGRDPLTTGGLFGPEAFAPMSLPVANAPLPGEPVQDFSEFIHAAQEAEVISAVPGRPVAAAPVPDDAGAQPVAAPEPAAPEAPAPAPQMAAPAPAPSVSVDAPAAQAAPEVHPDAAVEQTQLRRVEPTPARLVFDDGQTLTVAESLLIGRNPAAAEGEQVSELFSLADISRSVSKTHLLVQVAANGVWVTDRRSTNGSALVDASGQRRRLEPGQPLKAAMGDTVWLGDRFFRVERA